MAAGAAMIGPRFGIISAGNSSVVGNRVFQCHPGGTREAALVLTLGGMGIAANLILMGVILAKRQLRRWSQGLLFHQAMVDCARAAILLPLGVSIIRCQPVHKCSLVETAFLLLVTVSTVNMLTTVLNDSPVFPEDENDEQELTGPLLMDSPQCVLFGAFMIWFASITINLGPTFLSGALAANVESGHNAPSCPLVHGPFRHYVLNVLWILINIICVVLTLFHLRKLHRDLTKANVEAVRVAGLVTTLVSVTGGGLRSRANTAPSSANGPTVTQQQQENTDITEMPNSIPPPPRQTPPAFHSSLATIPLSEPTQNHIMDDGQMMTSPIHHLMPTKTLSCTSLAARTTTNNHHSSGSHPSLIIPPPVSLGNGTLCDEVVRNQRNSNGGLTGIGGGVGALEEHRRMRNYLRRMEQEGVQRVKMFLIITAAYVLFWGPLFFVTLVHHPLIGNQLGFEITLHISYFHAVINPTLFLLLHRGLRQALLDICCGCCFHCTHLLYGLTDHVTNTFASGNSPSNISSSMGGMNLPPPPPHPQHPPARSISSDISLLKMNNNTNTSLTTTQDMMMGGSCNGGVESPGLIPPPPLPPGVGNHMMGMNNMMNMSNMMNSGGSPPTVLPHSELGNTNLILSQNNQQMVTTSKNLTPISTNMEDNEIYNIYNIPIQQYNKNDSTTNDYSNITLNQHYQQYSSNSIYSETASLSCSE